ncbi:hypothetical protein [Gilliamella apicola]|uniref:hypothetical protein n=1 Tax=Gilliamella apicola TaxID=1196095 RepID=UPI000A060B29|nr:hypothetical protein [Gilliamella apicola]ORF43922.1 hypothetical protein B5800_13185 [Gilliamella apicola]ORF47252.1 hypothetical protein B5799_13235 [Gilliamella apicola]ORF48943.1 hypothetical protein B5803_10765 [Gilliamella apicola]ORF51674.1 hypothetical protein B5798_13040 [Gilliamella apicola]ORF51889.1 hypothetical protein B5802_10650 [Gilliamella apicola]
MKNSNNDQLINNIETKLAQAQSMIKVILDNHNYKNKGLDEPFIDHCDTDNLLWVAGDLIEDAYKELLNIDFEGGKNNG